MKSNRHRHPDPAKSQVSAVCTSVIHFLKAGLVTTWSHRFAASTSRCPWTVSYWVLDAPAVCTLAGGLEPGPEGSVGVWSGGRTSRTVMSSTTSSEREWIMRLVTSEVFSPRVSPRGERSPYLALLRLTVVRVETRMPSVVNPRQLSGLPDRGWSDWQTLSGESACCRSHRPGCPVR